MKYGNGGNTLKKNSISRVIMSVSLTFGSIIMLAFIWTFAPSFMQKELTTIEIEDVPLAQNIYDSEDRAILIYKNPEEHSIQLQNIKTGKRYTLYYNGTTIFMDKNEQPLSIQQIDCGMMVHVLFYKETKSVIRVQEIKDCICIPEIQQYKLDLQNKTMVINDCTYQLNSHLSIISEDKEIELMDLNQMDTITVWGYQDQIYSIQVINGHGYLRLENCTYFVNGWIDIGQKIIKKVTDDMLIVVPEGTFMTTITNNQSTATQQITFRKNEEIVWDLSTVEITLPKTGTIIFTISPDNATTVIDGEKTDISEPVELTYGVHQITVTAPDYETLAKYIKVGAPSANIALTLEQKNNITNQTAKDTKNETIDKATDDATTENKERKETVSETEEKADQTDVASITNTCKVHIDSPENTEIYIDGNYIGISPVSFDKKAGNYIVTLRKDGYQTRSYTLQVDSEEKDVNYSFADLLPKQ